MTYLFCFYIKWKGRVRIPRENSMRKMDTTSTPFPPGNRFGILIPFLLSNFMQIWTLQRITRVKTSQSRFILIAAIVVAPRSLFNFGAISQCAYHSPTLPGWKIPRQKTTSETSGQKKEFFSFFSLACVWHVNISPDSLDRIHHGWPTCEHLFPCWLPFFWLDKEIGICKLY
jgi:hypothetical protein